jgi:hypothetical protein
MQKKQQSVYIPCGFIIKKLVSNYEHSQLDTVPHSCAMLSSVPVAAVREPIITSSHILKQGF